MDDQIDPFVMRLTELANAATDPSARYAYLLHAMLRPGITEFVRTVVLKHGGPKLDELPDIYMAVFSSLTAEVIENYMLNTGEHRQARRAMVRFCKERFASQLDDRMRQRPEYPSPMMRRADA